MQAFDTVKNGELQGSASVERMPDVPCNLVKFKALASNSGNVYIGTSRPGNVLTKADGSNDTTAGFELAPGDESGWIPVSNVNRFFRICDNAGDDLTYLALL